MADPTEIPQTADQLRAKFGAEILVPLPGGGAWRCRRPDIKTLLFEDILSMPVLEQVLADLRPHENGKDKTLQDLIEEPAAASRTGDFVRRWLTLAAKSPRIVLEETDAGPDALWVQDVPINVRMAIFNATFWDVTPAAGSAPAAAAFPKGPAGPVAAGDGADVSRAPERADAPDGSR